MDPVQAVTVKIFGEDYRIAGDGDPRRIHELAHYVDEKMRAVKERMVSVHPAKVAVLASLNIADELMKERQRREQLERQLGERAARLNQVLDDLLQDSAR